jgi:hypothetical protein
MSSLYSISSNYNRPKEDVFKCVLLGKEKLSALWHPSYYLNVIDYSAKQLSCRVLRVKEDRIKVIQINSKIFLSIKMLLYSFTDNFHLNELKNQFVS